MEPINDRSFYQDLVTYDCIILLEQEEIHPKILVQ